ncbi:MAG: TRIC cation channel family protein [Actinomycetaceae bacterium]|nr:TRIC cation channel family protein [Arcanobacterium sp.]MDD7505489.1 TRIC cation channel family protein [Actinomycetaceae bacterium]MDY6143470.1 TRIC cation channel family protein [Arcanobacterium sp.]
MDPESIFRVVDVTGVIANGLIGADLARKHRFDLVGFLVLGACSALGGGLTRDMMLGLGFPVALTDPWYLSGAFGAATFAYFFALEGKMWQQFIGFADVLALGCWSATGASKGFAAGLGWIPSIFLGVVTAVMGGIIRDLMVHQTPGIFGGKPLYATFSVVAAAQMVAFQSSGHYAIGMGTAIVLCAVFGLLARHHNWILPEPYDFSRFINTRPQAPRGWPTNSRAGRRRLRRLRERHRSKSDD